MSGTTEHTKWVLELVDGMSKNMASIAANVQGVTEKMTGLEKNIRRIDSVNLSAIAGSFDALHNRLNNAVEPGIRFQSSMADLEALTGVTGKGLDVIATNARKLTKELGGDGAGTLEVYKLLLGQLTPELAKQPEVLNAMARNAILLGKTMGGDTAGAVEVLTTAMNQYAVDTSNPIQASMEMARMMNVMAAAAAAGSAELPALKAGLNEAGGDAMRAGVKFEETAAALEVLDKAGLKESRGGVALRNILNSLAQGRFLPDDVQKELRGAGIDIEQLGNKSLTLKQRMELLLPIQSDSALMAKLFGRETSGGASALLSMTDLLGDYTQQVTGTTAANDQASVVMGTFAERMSRMKASIGDIGIGIFNTTQKFLPFLDAGFAGVSMLADLRNAQAGLAMIMDTRLMKSIGNTIVAMRTMSVVEMLQAGVTNVVTVATAAWNAVLALNPIVWVVAAIGALVAGIIYAWNHFEGFRTVVFGLWEALKSAFGWIADVCSPIIDGVVLVFKLWWAGITAVWDVLIGGIKKVGSWFDKLWQWIVGLKDKAVGAFRLLADIMLAPFRKVTDFISKIPGVGRLVQGMKELGTKVGEAYAEGAEKGRSSFKTDNVDALAESGGLGTDQGAAAGKAAGFPDAGLAAGKSVAGPSTATIGGKGGGGDKNIAINMTLNQHFRLDGAASFTLKQAADEVLRMITNGTRDAAYTL